MQEELQVMFEELNLSISLEEIKDGIRQLRNGASAGPDLFLNEFLKQGTNELITSHICIVYLIKCLNWVIFRDDGQKDI